MQVLDSWSEETTILSIVGKFRHTEHANAQYTIGSVFLVVEFDPSNCGRNLILTMRGLSTYQPEARMRLTIWPQNR